MKSTAGIPDFRKKYLRHCDINHYLDFLQIKYPHLVLVSTIGLSFEGRLLKSIRISSTSSASKINKAAKRSKSAAVKKTNCAFEPTSAIGGHSKFIPESKKSIVLIDGGIHAREWCTISTALYCVSELTENYESNKSLLEHFDFVIIPVINADGYEYSRTFKKMWRKTRRPIQSSTFTGVDCNRNFSVGWNTACDRASSYTYRGEKPFSEPETKIMKYLMHSLRPKFYLTLHSFGKSIMYPYGYTRILPEKWESLRDLANAGSTAILKKTGSKFRIGNVASIIKNPADCGGGSLDYAHNCAKIPFAIAMELAGGSFQPSAQAIINVAQESWIGIRAMCLFLKIRAQ